MASSSSRPTRGRGPPQHAPHAPPPHRQAFGPGHPDDDPGPHPRQLEGELAAQHDHGAHVLQGGREPQLADERRAPLGRLDRDPAHPGQPQREEGERHHDRHHARPDRLHRPQADPPPQHRGRRGDGADHLACAGGHEPHADRGADPRPQVPRRGHEGGAEGEDRGRHRVRGGARHPGGGRARQAVGGQEPGGQADGRGHERQEPELAQHRPAQGPSPIERRQEHVPDVRLLQHERAAAAPRPQPDGDRQRGGETEPGVAVGGDRGHLGRVERAVADDPGEPVEREGAGETCQLGAVEGVDPVDVVEAAALPPPPPLGE